MSGQSIRQHRPKSVRSMRLTEETTTVMREFVDVGCVPVLRGK